MRLNVSELVGSNICAGAQGGRELLLKLLAATNQDPATAQPVFLDFASIDVATVSFLRESALAYRNVMRDRRSSFYPVIANPNEAVKEELIETVRAKGDVLLTCTLSPSGHVSQQATLGQLEPKQKIVFDLISERGGTDATELQREFGAVEGVKQTAWNNRLASLASAGLVVEVNQGRSKRYRPLLEGV